MGGSHLDPEASGRVGREEVGGKEREEGEGSRDSTVSSNAYHESY